MNLDTPDKTIEIVLGEAMVTANCDITAAYAIVATDAFLLAASDLVSNGTTPVTVIPAPTLPPGAGAQQNQVKEIRLHNNDTVTHQVTLRLNNGGTIRIMETASVGSGGDFLYTPDTGAEVSSAGPAILLETGTTGAKISSLPAFDLALPPVGTEPFPVVEGGADTKMTLAQLYTLFADWLNIIFANPLDAAGGSGASGLGFEFIAGTGDGVGAGGLLTLQAGNGGTNGAGGGAQLRAGNSGGGDNPGGTFSFTAGVGTGTADGGAALFDAGTASGSGAGGQFSLQGGQAAGAGAGGLVQLFGGASSTGIGGDVAIAGGTGGAGTGNVLMAALPTADPSVASAVWASNSRLVKSGAIITPVASTVTSGSAVALVTGTAKDVTTISVPTGNWTITGALYFTGNAATTVTLVQGSVGTTANTLDTTPGQFDTEYLAGATLTVLGADPALLGFSADVSLGGTTTYRLDAKATFAINTLSAYGTIRAVPRA